MLSSFFAAALICLPDASVAARRHTIAARRATDDGASPSAEVDYETMHVEDLGTCNSYCVSEPSSWRDKCKWNGKCEGCKQCQAPSFEPLDVKTKDGDCLCCSKKFGDPNGESWTKRYTLYGCLKATTFTAPANSEHCTELCAKSADSPSRTHRLYTEAKYADHENCFGKNTRLGDNNANGLSDMFARGLNKVAKRLGSVAQCDEDADYEQAVQMMHSQVKKIAREWKDNALGENRTHRKRESKTDMTGKLNGLRKPGSARTRTKMKECEGDCDRDSDCEGTLKCFQRRGFRPIPGCKGSGEKGWDYCSKEGNENARKSIGASEGRSPSGGRGRGAQSNPRAAQNAQSGGRGGTPSGGRAAQRPTPRPSSEHSASAARPTPRPAPRSGSASIGDITFTESSSTGGRASQHVSRGGTNSVRGSAHRGSSSRGSSSRGSSSRGSSVRGSAPRGSAPRGSSGRGSIRASECKDNSDRVRGYLSGFGVNVTGCSDNVITSKYCQHPERGEEVRDKCPVVCGMCETLKFDKLSDECKAVWETPAGRSQKPCGRRIRYLIEEEGRSQGAAVKYVSRTLPEECGPCGIKGEKEKDASKCKQDCATNPHTWSSKCGWEASCSECSACKDPEQMSSDNSTEDDDETDDDTLTRYINAYDEEIFPYMEAKLHMMQERVDGSVRLHSPFEHVCGANAFEVNETMGYDGPSEFISFSNAGKFPEVASDCTSNFDQGQRRIQVSMSSVRKQGGIVIDVSDKDKAFKWCYYGGNVKILGKNYWLAGAKDIKAWPYKCAKSVYQTELKQSWGSPDESWWTKDNRWWVAEKCATWATFAHEVLVLPNPRIVDNKPEKKRIIRNSLKVKNHREPVPQDKLCFFEPTDKCVSLNPEKKEVCCCSMECSTTPCPFAPGA